MLIFSFQETERLARNVAKRVKGEYSLIELDKFPDNEIYLRIRKNIKGKEVVLIESYFNPDEKIIRTLFFAYTARELGAKKVRLVASYLPYIRQDKRFKEGEVISSKIIGKLFSIFDEIIAIDPHLHRYKSLSEIFYTNVKKLSANHLIKEYIKNNFKNSVIIGPDEESYQWALNIAKELKTNATILQKKRFSSRKVSVKLMHDIEVKGKKVVVIDDMVSTGHTVIEAVKLLKKKKAKEIDAVCVHGLFVEDADKKLRKYGVRNIVSTNTIESKYSKIDVSGLIGDALRIKNRYIYIVL